MSVSARARGQLELSHAHSAYCRLNGEHSNARTDTRRPWCWSWWSCREVLSEQQVLYLFFCVCDFVGLEPSGTWSPRRRESNALVGYTTGPSSSGGRPAIGFFFHSLLRLTSFLSQYKKKVLYRLLASVLSVGTSPWQWLRVTSRQQLAVDVNSPWLMAGVGLELEKVGDEERAQRSIRSPADFRRWFSLITTYNHMNFPTAAVEVETHKFQLSIVYHLLLFSVGVRRLPRSRFLASAMLSKDSTRTELGKRPIPTRGVGHNLNTITYRRSLLSRQPNSYHRRNRKDKREDNLVSHSLLLFGYSGNNQVTSSPGWDIARRDQGRVASPLSFFFTTP